MLISGVEIPEDLLYLIEHQTWARLLPGGSALLGITALGLKASGEFYMCRPRAVGQELGQGRTMAVVELAKSIVSVKAPLSGEVIASNALLTERPELVHADPYGQGWLLEIRPSALAAERSVLCEGEAVQAAMEHYAWLMNQTT